MRNLQIVLIAGALALAGPAALAQRVVQKWGTFWFGGSVSDCEQSPYTETWMGPRIGCIPHETGSLSCILVDQIAYLNADDYAATNGPACEAAFGSRGESSSAASRTEPAKTRPPPKRDEGVASIQESLAQCDFNPGPVDGLWGRKTAAAAKEFVKAHGGAPKEARLDLIVQVDGYRVGDAGPCPRRVGVAGEDLSGQDFRNADLAGQDLAETKFRDADLSGADLGEANLSGADLDGANLSGANLSGANLDHASLHRANLSGANLSGARLENADLSGANLDHTSLYRANLSGANLSGADLRTAKMTATLFKEAVLDRANLVGADLRKTLMTGASLSGAALAGVRFSGATGLAVAQLSVAHWAGRAAEWVQKEAFEDFKEGTDKLMAVIVEDDGSFRIPVPKGQ